MSENPTIEEEKQKTKNKPPPPKKNSKTNTPPKYKENPVETSIPHANIYMSTCFPGLVQSLQ